MANNPFNETMTFDLTARGISVIVTPLAGGAPVTIDDFPDDLDPLTIDEAEFADIKMDANGSWYRQQKAVPVSLHISVIPGTKAEKAMSGLIPRAMFADSTHKFNITVSYPTTSDNAPLFENKTFKNGYMTGCSLGYSATSQGRVRTKQFTFKFPPNSPQ